jgi:hypothetical protein
LNLSSANLPKSDYYFYLFQDGLVYVKKSGSSSTKTIEKSKFQGRISIYDVDVVPVVPEDSDRNFSLKFH